MGWNGMDRIECDSVECGRKCDVSDRIRCNGTGWIGCDGIANDETAHDR